MAEKTKGEVEQFPETQPAGLGGVLSEKISRRSFGKLLGAQTVLASSVTLSGCLGGGGGGSDDAPAPEISTATLSPAAGAAAPAASGLAAAWLPLSPQADRPRAMASERAARPVVCSFMRHSIAGEMPAAPADAAMK